MRVIRHRQIQTDPWQLDSGEGELPSSGDLIVPLARWQSARAELLARKSKLGIALNSNELLEPILADLNHFALIGLRFNHFRDGQGYSHAWLLRQRYGYQGELRALGDIARDQLAFMQRVGIDSFALRDDQNAAEALQAFDEISIIYQPSVGGELIFRQRAWQPASQ